MGFLVENYSLNELHRIAVPGAVTPSLFWALPVGQWDRGELENVWRWFTESPSECNDYGLLLVKEMGILDDQLQKTVKQFMQVSATVGHAKKSGDLRRFIAEGRKIIITTVQKFPFILDEMDSEGAGKNFAIVIDEAHSSQGGKTASAMSKALGEKDEEDEINDAIEERIKSRRLLTNASYFAFTATPKNKTLELFGIPLPPDSEGKIKHRPFNSYTMKQAIQEGFILDVLRSYTPVESYYRLVKKIEDDPEFDKKRARKKLRRYVESHDHAIRLKAEIMVDHFHDHVMSVGKIASIPTVVNPRSLETRKQVMDC